MFEMRVDCHALPGLDIIATNAVDGGNILNCPSLAISFLDESENVIKNANLYDYLEEADVDYLLPPRPEVNYDLTMSDAVWKPVRILMCDEGVSLYFLDTEHPELDPNCDFASGEYEIGHFFRYFNEQMNIQFLCMKVSGYSSENRYFIYKQDYRDYQQHHSHHWRSCKHIHIVEYKNNRMIKEYESFRPRMNSDFLYSCLNEYHY